MLKALCNSRTEKSGGETNYRYRKGRTRTGATSEPMRDSDLETGQMFSAGRRQEEFKRRSCRGKRLDGTFSGREHRGSYCKFRFFGFVLEMFNRQSRPYLFLFKLIATLSSIYEFCNGLIIEAQT
jgi:hypothetical protein